METCKVVVSTCAFGGGDDLYQPIGMSSASLNKVNIHLQALLSVNLQTLFAVCLLSCLPIRSAMWHFGMKLL